MKIILGSQSQGRQQVLRDAGVQFTLAAADIDEKAIRHDDFEQLPLLVARAKADALTKNLSGPGLLITADTVVTYGGELREKPTSIDEARRFLMSYEPNTAAWVNTGVVVTNLATGKRVEGFDKAAVYFDKISPEDIEQIIKHGVSMQCAGGFAIEDPLFSKYINRFDGAKDAIIGLPINLTQQLLVESQT